MTMNGNKNHNLLLTFTLLCAAVFAEANQVRADPPATQAAAKSTAVNGGFEDWTAAPTPLQKAMDCPQTPAGWGVEPRQDPASCSLQRDAAVKHGGDCSVRMANTNTKAGLSIARRIDAEPQCRYLIRLWLKADHVDQYHPKGVIMHLAASSQHDKKDFGLYAGLLRQADITPTPHSGTFDWKELVCSFDTPVDTRSILLLVELRGAGIVWLDDVRVTRLEKCIEVESY